MTTSDDKQIVNEAFNAITNRISVIEHTRSTNTDLLKVRASNEAEETSDLLITHLLAITNNARVRFNLYKVLCTSDANKLANVLKQPKKDLSQVTHLQAYYNKIFHNLAEQQDLQRFIYLFSALENSKPNKILEDKTNKK